MPREIVLLSPTAPDLHALLSAGAEIDPELGLRTIGGGAVHQICDADERAVLSVLQPRRVENHDEVARLLPDAPPIRVGVWWVDLLAPWGERGDIGVRIASALAARLGAVCVVQDGR